MTHFLLVTLSLSKLIHPHSLNHYIYPEDDNSVDLFCISPLSFGLCLNCLTYLKANSNLNISPQRLLFFSLTWSSLRSLYPQKCHFYDHSHYRSLTEKMFVEHLPCVRIWRYHEPQTRPQPLWSWYSSGGGNHSASMEANILMDFRKG